jgi:protein SCO1/2/putative membrane protein
LLIVLYTVLASGVLCLGAVRSPRETPAAQDLGEASTDLGPIRLTERSGEPVTDATLSDRVWIGSFIFTRCALSCPRISSIMKSLQGRLEGTDVLLVSISVDPEHDTPAVLADYAKRFGAIPGRWWFLTGDRDAIYEMIASRFHLTALTNPAPDPDGKDEAIVHSDRLALVDHGKIVGLYDSQEPKALDDLIAEARRRALPAWVRTLPAVNASLNGLCTVLLLVGWALIRRPVARRAVPPLSSASEAIRSPITRGHVVVMALAFTAAAVFLGSYLCYHYFAGSVKFRGGGAIQWIYLTILLSHIVLAGLGVAPLALLILYRALRGDFARHARLARLTLPIWLYVSITGVVIYLMLYRMPVPPNSVSVNSLGKTEEAPSLPCPFPFADASLWARLPEDVQAEVVRLVGPYLPVRDPESA